MSRREAYPRVACRHCACGIPHDAKCSHCQAKVQAEHRCLACHAEVAHGIIPQGSVNFFGGLPGMGVDDDPDAFARALDQD